jgi:hypothetical protein
VAVSALRTIAIGTGGIAAGLGIAVLLARAPTPSPDSGRSAADSAEIARLRTLLGEISAEFDTARGEEAILRAELSRARQALADRSPQPKLTDGFPLAARFGAMSGPGRAIRSLGEAESAYEEALAAGDLETLWLLGADLLAFGERGHPLFERLLERFITDTEEGAGPFERIWGEEELWMGRFFRAFAEEHEGFLAYGLSLAERDESNLGPALGHVRRALFDDEVLPILLAFHGGENADLTAGWLDHFEMRLGLPDLGGADPETILFSIAQIPGDRAAELLVQWIETHPEHRDDAIDALLLQGSPRADQALRALLATISDDALRAAIERRLGG